MNISTHNNKEDGDYFSELTIPIICILVLITLFFDGSFFTSMPPESISDWMRIIAAIGISPIILLGCIGIFKYFRNSKEE